MSAAAVSVELLDEEERLRAHPYRLLAGLLAGPPGPATLEAVAALQGDASELGRSLGPLAQAARAADAATVAAEYQALFIGLGRGELVPYGSFYLTGFLHEKPLGVLRTDLEQLGLRRTARNADPEDHIAALCEVMAALIEGEAGDGTLAQQRRFFERHLAPWAGRFFKDLEQATAARFYAPVGTFGRTYLAVEARAFAMLD